MYKDMHKLPSGCLVLAVFPTVCDEGTLNDRYYRPILTCNRSCGSCQLRYF